MQIYVGKIVCEQYHLHSPRDEQPHVLGNGSEVFSKVWWLCSTCLRRGGFCQVIDFFQPFEWWPESFCCVVISQRRSDSLLKLDHMCIWYLWYAWKLITLWIYSTQRKASESQFAVHWINVSYWFLWLSTSEVMPCLLLIRGGTVQYIIKCN